ncbi:MAG: hypothetical protein E7487_10055 [Ruminococcaceae bacterium]|nr:hypothetical protein [Oscillospiraceae bacterium]
MKKKLLIAALALFIILFSAQLLFRTTGGDTSDLHRISGASELYTDDEIEQIMEIVEQHFKKEFNGCRMTELEYNESFSLKACDEWASQYAADRAIVLTSSFFVGLFADESLTTNTTYRNWQWILTKNNGEPWILQTWGY